MTNCHWIMSCVLAFLLAQFPTPIWAAMASIGGQRPASIKLPASYDAQQSYPLLVLLHGYGSRAAETANYLEASLYQAEAPSIMLAPEGTLDTNGRHYWSYKLPQKADEADDSAYIQGLIAEARQRYHVDASRIYVIGISNGAFMAYRLACDTDGLFAGVVAIAGGMFADASLCRSKTPISLLHIHGNQDRIVPFQSQWPDTLGAVESVQYWAKKNRCQTFQETSSAFDIMLQAAIPGLVLGPEDRVPLEAIVTDDQGARETDQLLWTDCEQTHRVGLWRVNGGSHVPDYSGKHFMAQIMKFFGRGKR